MKLFLIAHHVFFIIMMFLSLPVIHSWEYNENGSNDLFGVQDFDVKVKSKNEIKLVIRALPHITIVPGSGRRIPQLGIKIYEVDSNKQVHKERLKLCDYSEPNCPLKGHVDAEISVKGLFSHCLHFESFQLQDVHISSTYFSNLFQSKT